MVHRTALAVIGCLFLVSCDAIEEPVPKSQGRPVPEEAMGFFLCEKVKPNEAYLEYIEGLTPDQAYKRDQNGEMGSDAWGVPAGTELFGGELTKVSITSWDYEIRHFEIKGDPKAIMDAAVVAAEKTYGTAYKGWQTTVQRRDGHLGWLIRGSLDAFSLDVTEDGTGVVGACTVNES